MKKVRFLVCMFFVFAFLSLSQKEALDNSYIRFKVEDECHCHKCLKSAVKSKITVFDSIYNEIIQRMSYTTICKNNTVVSPIYKFLIVKPKFRIQSARRNTGEDDYMWQKTVEKIEQMFYYKDKDFRDVFLYLKGAFMNGIQNYDYKVIRKSR